MAGGPCPQGHTSTWDDFCSVCGESMESDPAAGSAAAAPLTSAPTASAGDCPNCSTDYGAEDVFCENCGYDFATGTLPDPDSDSTPPAAVASSVAAASAIPKAPHGDRADADAKAPGEPTATETPSAPSEEPTANESGDSPEDPQAASANQAGGSTDSGPSAIVSCDRAYFDEIASEIDLDYPDPEPAPTTISLSGGKILIGRHNQSRGVYPEIDVDACTGDPAASTRHAMLRRTADGSWTINDLDSTNGTMLDDNRTIISSGTEIPVQDGTVIYVGAYTRITLKLDT